jgi:hypothetical protein
VYNRVKFETLKPPIANSLTVREELGRPEGNPRRRINGYVVIKKYTDCWSKGIFCIDRTVLQQA